MDTDETGWQLVRVKADFTNDTDWAGTNTPPDPADTFNVPTYRAITGGAPTKLIIRCIAVDSAGAPVARAGETFDFQLVEVGRSHGDGDSYQPRDFVDDTPVVSSTYNRRIIVDVAARGRYAVRLSNFSGTPTGGNSIRIYAQVA